jgi:hypothetical protein
MTGALDRHGTRAFVLKPSALAKAAEADLALRNQKRDGKRAAGVAYTFHRRHVRRATCALDLVDRALADRYSGVWSKKRVTRLVYGDEDALVATRALLSPCDEAAAS